MTQSAITDRRARTMQSITRCARDLCAERGLDGFTMDELAASAGVSRRTLFNYVPGKVDAVLGVSSETDSSHLSEFLAGGPTGDLIQDIRAAVLKGLESNSPDIEEFHQFRQLVRADARLQQVVHDRFVEATELVSEAIEQREGRADPVATRIIVVLMIGLLDLALDESLADPSAEFIDHFSRVFDTATALFAGTRTS